MTDYNFLDESAEKPELSLPHRLLTDAGRKLGVLSIATGQHSDILQGAAIAHAGHQALVGKQGHQGWDSRVKALAQLMPACSEFKECCAQSWDWNTLEEAAPEMFVSWRQSPGHWSAINGPCEFYGYAMALNERQNIWYAAAIFANLRRQNEK